MQLGLWRAIGIVMLGLEGRGSEAVSIFLSFLLSSSSFFFFLCYCGKWEISTWINKMGNRDSPHDSDHFLTLAEQEQRTKALSDATA